MKKTNKKKINILNQVELSDLLKVRVFMPKPGEAQIVFECLDKNKKLVFDKKALDTFNDAITEKTTGMNFADPKTKAYLCEYSLKMAAALYKNGLCEICEQTEMPEDYYSDMRHQFDHLNKN